MTNSTISSVKDRRSYILAVLKKNGETITNQHELCKELGVNQTTISRDMRELRNVYPENIVKKETKGTHGGYFWMETKKEKANNSVSEEIKSGPEKKPAVDLSKNDRYKESKNDEGYSDPTAYAAMKSMEVRFKPGDIWINDYNGFAETYFVLAATAKAVTCIPLVKSLDKVPECERADMVPLRHSPMVSYYFNPTKIYTKPARYFKERVGYFGKAFELVSGKVNGYLKLCPVDRVEVPVVIDRDIPPVEKIKEVKVEVPVEVEKIIYKDDPELSKRLAELEKELRETKELLAMSEHENELKTQRGDIWESVAKSLLKKGV